MAADTGTDNDQIVIESLTHADLPRVLPDFSLQ